MCGREKRTRGSHIGIAGGDSNYVDGVTWFQHRPDRCPHATIPTATSSSDWNHQRRIYFHSVIAAQECGAITARWGQSGRLIRYWLDSRLEFDWRRRVRGLQPGERANS